MAAKTPTITRVRVARDELDKMSKEQLLKCWNLQDQYVDLIENKLHNNSEHTELLSLKENEEKLKQQQLDASSRANILVMRLTTKEHEMQEFAAQIQELKQAQVPSIGQLRSAMLDPAVNLLFERMRKEVESLKARLEESQNELNAWKFTPDSNTGKRLMAKCRLLYQENEELGRIISSGRMAKLEGDLALQKSFSEEMKKSQSELDEFLLELDEDVEGMQSTIYYLQQQLREAKEQIAQLQKEKFDLPNGLSEDHSTERTSKSPQDSELNQLSQSNSKVRLPNDVNGGKKVLESVKRETNCTAEISKDNGEKDIKPSKSELAFYAQKLTKELAAPLTEVTVQSVIVENKSSVIVENKTSVNHDKQVPLVERTNHIVDEVEAPEKAPKRTKNDQKIDGTDPATANPSENTNDSAAQQKTNKRTSDAAKSRKRTRPRTPEEIKEENLPVRKRTRHRDAAMTEDVADSNRTSVEIDTDAEVQAAQTLAAWAATKQDRTEIKTEVVDSSSINGELVVKVEAQEK